MAPFLDFVGGLLHGPGFGTIEHRLQVRLAALGEGLGDLAVDQRVERVLLYGAEHADGFG
ncbi:MAG: hypothetical protein ABSB74_21455 [Tepidisphaeraceae bacterium]